MPLSNKNIWKNLSDYIALKFWFSYKFKIIKDLIKKKNLDDFICNLITQQILWLLIYFKNWSNIRRLIIFIKKRLKKINKKINFIAFNSK